MREHPQKTPTLSSLFFQIFCTSSSVQLLQMPPHELPSIPFSKILLPACILPQKLGFLTFEIFMIELGSELGVLSVCRWSLPQVQPNPRT